MSNEIVLICDHPRYMTTIFIDVNTCKMPELLNISFMCIFLLIEGAIFIERIAMHIVKKQFKLLLVNDGFYR